MTSSSAEVKRDFTIATRGGSLIAYIASRCPGRAVALDLGSLAFTLRCTRDYLRKMTMRMRTRSWMFQGNNTILFIRYRRHVRAKCGVATLYAINRHWMNTIGGEAPRVRWHRNKRSWEEWDSYLHRMRNLAFAMIFRKRNLASGTHKGLSTPQQSRKIGKQTANRPRWRVFLGLAGDLAQHFERTWPASGISWRGWAARRLSEGHGYVSILQALGHAKATMDRHSEPDETGEPRWIPENPAGWVSGIALRTLEFDGLTPYIRWREKGRLKKRHAAGAATLKVEDSGRRLARLIEWDKKRESLRERKTLPDGSEIEYDPRLGYWIDVKN